MRVHFIGEPDDGITVSSHHARALRSSGIEAYFDPPEGSERPPRGRADLIHLVTFEQTEFDLLRRLAMARMSGVGIVRFWTGVDVLWAERHAPSRRFAQGITRLGAAQWARNEELVERLARCCVPTTVGPVLSLHVDSTHEPEPLPATFTLLAHLPSSRRESAGGSLLDRLVERLPGVRFLILGDTRTDYASRKNVESLGVVEDPTRAIQRSTAVIVPRVDGALSRLSLEAMCHGRHVIASHPSPHVRQADSLASYVAAIRALERNVEFNLAGREYVCERYGKARMTRELSSRIEACGDPGDAGRGDAGRWGGGLAALCHAGVMRRKWFPLPDPAGLPSDDPFRALVADAVRTRRWRSPEAVHG